MARSADGKRRPRIRKSAPTVRERAEAAREKSDSKKPKRYRLILAKPAAPVRKLNLGQRQPVRALKKGLSWLMPRYLINSWRELKQVHWPNRRETWRLTLAVFVFAIIFGALVAGVDKSLDDLFKKVVLK